MARQPSQRLVIELHGVNAGHGWQVRVDLEDGDQAPHDQDDHHDGGDPHDEHRLFAALVDALQVLPPEVQHDQDGASGGEVVLVKANGVAEVAAQFFDESGEVLASGDGADRPCQHVIEQQRRDRELGQRGAHGLFHHAVHAAAHEHAAALDVHGAHRVAEQHDRQNEPRRALANHVLGIAAHVVGGGGQVGEHDRRCPPEGDEGQHHRGGNKHRYGRLQTVERRS